MNKTPSFFMAASVVAQHHSAFNTHFDECGRCLLPNLAAARELSAKLAPIKKDVSPGKLFATALLHDTMLFLIEKSGLMKRESATLRTLFVEEMSLGSLPKCSIHANHELLITTLFRENQALKPLHFLLAPDSLFLHTQRFFSLDEVNQPFPELPDKTLLSLLREPFVLYPTDLNRQLSYISEKWAPLLPQIFRQRIAQGSDFLKEEFRPVFPPGPGPTQLPNFSLQADEGEIKDEIYTTDTAWMPRAVMIAKNCFVWLDQLSKQYNRSISRLDEIPEDEVKKMASRGFNTLWLIGVWERSHASKTIKQIRGNSEAESSAYSLIRYDIAQELGGNSALQEFAEMAEKHGVRLAGDMVPNHTAIDSDWIYDHPDWFIQRDDLPFDYSFTGPDLSRKEEITIQIEDGYWNDSDAAVVFRYHEHNTGRVRYIYHGNDGTTMPWNDTAQLNFTDEAVRYAVKETIFHVASLFSVIRFDAAMTLTKRHFHRLWFPAPGSGGDIPSRAEYAQTQEEFNRGMPYEFWRTVVDEALHRSPETLLLAEAFWLMESYFVRSLGMHRVYNSAFMNFLKDEEGAKFRQALKSVLEYDTDVLQRYVNFLSNPDEDSTVEQFGDGDKSLGATLLLITMPGLPMFAHGQVDGFKEKYGMEYRRSYWNEQVNWELVKQHEEKIFPLMKKRHLFSGVSQFHLFDMYNAEHNRVHESVIAYTNGNAGKRVLILFNNSSITCNGTLTQSTPKRNKEIQALQTTMISKETGISRGGGFLLFENLLSNEWYIRPVDEIMNNGFYWILGPYEQRCFTSFKQVFSDELHPWNALYERVGQQPFHNPWELLNALKYQDLEHALADIFSVKMVTKMVKARGRALSTSRAFSLKTLMTTLNTLIKTLYNVDVFTVFSEDNITNQTIDRLENAILLPQHLKKVFPSSKKDSLLFEGLISDNRFEFIALLQWVFIADSPWDFVKKLPLSIYFKNMLMTNGASEAHALLLSRIPEAFLLLDQFVTDAESSGEDLFAYLITHQFFRSLLMINRWQDEEFCNKEALRILVRGFMVTALIRDISTSKTPKRASSELLATIQIGTEILNAAEEGHYSIQQIVKLLRNTD